MRGKLWRENSKITHDEGVSSIILEVSSSSQSFQIMTCESTLYREAHGIFDMLG